MFWSNFCLISNLETENDKLIQIILAGQPELEQLLRRPDLRQLNLPAYSSEVCTFKAMGMDENTCLHPAPYGSCR